MTTSSAMSGFSVLTSLGVASNAIVIWTVAAVLFVWISVVVLALAVVPGCLAAKRAGMPLGPVQVLAMRFRGVNPKQIIEMTSRALASGVRVLPEQIEEQQRRTGRAHLVVAAFIKLKQLGATVTWEDMCVIDNANRDVMDVVAKCGELRTIPIPTPELMPHIQAVAQDGIELCLRAEIVCQLHNVTNLVRGVPEAVLIARTGAAMVEEVGAAATHTEALADLDGIADRILAQRLDEDTPFRIVGLRIVEAKVGRDIGAMYRDGLL